MTSADGLAAAASRQYARAAMERSRASQQHVEVAARMDQRLVDSEMRATRRQLVQSLRRRIGTDGAQLLDEDFLALADPQAVLEAIVDAAVVRGLCNRADAQLLDADQRVLRIIACRGFSAKFVDTFSTLPLTAPTACVAAVTSGVPVL